MKSLTNWLVKLYQPEVDRVKWRLLLRFLGVESVLIQDEIALTQALLLDPPGLIIFDRTLFGDAFTANMSRFLSWTERGGGIAVTGHDERSLIPDLFLARMTDISERDPDTINTLLQRFIPTYSRQYPRMDTRLPGLYARIAGKSQLCEIMNLSPGGAFIRTTESLPSTGEELRVNVSLFGLHKEIELSSRVVSQILPKEGNNYAQGVGVSFIGEENSSDLIELNEYVRYVLAHDEALDSKLTPLSGCPSGRKKRAVKSFPARPVKGREQALTPHR